MLATAAFVATALIGSQARADGVQVSVLNCNVSSGWGFFGRKPAPKAGDMRAEPRASEKDAARDAARVVLRADGAARTAAW